MTDVGRFLVSRARGRAAALKPRTQCPGCKQQTLPPALTVCGNCWPRLSATTRGRLSLRDLKAVDRLQQVREQLAAGVPLARITVAP